jgi:DNA-binding XRE family transcriptional regulator
MAVQAKSVKFHPKTIVYESNVEYIAWLNTLHRGSAFGMKLRIQLGLNIQEVRRSRGFSQETLAHRADIDRGYIGKIENAKHAATIDMIEAIADALEIEAMELLKPRT